MNKYRKFTNLCGGLAVVFLFLFFLCLGMGILDNPRKIGINPSYVFSLLMLLFTLWGISLFIFLIGVFLSRERKVRESKDAPIQRRFPGLAVLLSLILGAGQLYNGQLIKAFLMWILFVFVMCLVGSLPLRNAFKDILTNVGILSVWIFAAFEAYITAKKINEGKISSRGSNLGCAVAFVVVILLLTAISIPGLRSARKMVNVKACIENLEQIESAKKAWANDSAASKEAVPTWLDLIPKYLKEKPVCRAGGIYTIGSLGSLPKCSIAENDSKLEIDNHEIIKKK